jgi:hypothetical protein
MLKGSEYKGYTIPLPSTSLAGIALLHDRVFIRSFLAIVLMLGRDMLLLNWIRGVL